MRLVEYVQGVLTDAPLGGSRQKGIAPQADSGAAYDDLARVQATNERYFMAYWIALIVVFLGTVVVALVFREEMGGLATVRGAGGVI